MIHISRKPVFASALVLAAALALALPSAAVAQTEAAPEAEAEADAATDLGLSMGEEVDQGPQMGDPYVLEVSGDWELRCIRTPLEHDPCAMHQLLQDQAGNSVATIEIVNLPTGGQAAAGATIVTPLETLLTEQITLSIDGSNGRRYPFTFCTPQGCVARVGFTQADVDAFRRGNAAQMVIVPAGAPDQQVQLTVSLAGVTAGFARMIELNALNAEAISAARAAQGEGATPE